MTARSPLLLGLAALVATAISAMGSLPPTGPGDRAPARPAIRGVADDGPFTCALVLAPQGAGTSVAGRVTARAPVAGTYALRLRAGGTAIDQGGDFDAAEGETVTLGEATLPGGADALDATLTVSAAGRSVACPRAK